MVRVIVGDLFASRAQTLVNTVNCVGVMGKGVALKFKERFPDMYRDYVQRCKAGQVKLGRPYLYRDLRPPFVLNFPTKDHWRSVSRLADIVAGLEHLEDHYEEWGIESLAVPPLGCGQGQLEWRVVGPTLYRFLNRLSIPVELYAPFGTPHEELQPEFLDANNASSPIPAAATKVSPAYVAIVDILARIEREPYHWPIGRTSFQKVAYFATEAGIPTGLEYHRGSYGPYAAELKAIETRLVNNGLVREERLGRMFAVRVGQTFDDAERAFAPQLRSWDKTLDRVADLFLRMDTDDAEVAATVHYVAREKGEGLQHPPTEMEVLEGVMEWKQRRRPPLDELEVAKAIRNLAMHGWIDVRPSAELPVTEDELIDG